MLMNPHLESIQDLLSGQDSLSTEHFELSYAIRNPRTVGGLGSHGVYDMSLIACYCDALEMLYGKMISPPFNRPPPIVQSGEKTQVFICDTRQRVFDGAFMDVDYVGNHDIPRIWLPTIHYDPYVSTMFERARAQAVHEATHVFNFRERPLTDHSRVIRSWHWLDEAFAIMMEIQTLPGNPDYLQFMADWVVDSAISLDNKDYPYCAGLFAQYMETLKSGFMNTVWTQSDDGETGFQALDRFSKMLLECPFSSPVTTDLFASGYCMDSYFLGNHDIASFATPVFERHGERGVRYSWDLAQEREGVLPDYLSHLACRYYRFFPSTRTDALTIQIELEHPNEDVCQIKAEAAYVDSEFRRSQRYPLRASSSQSQDRKTVLSGQFTKLNDDTDHLVLVVSNCRLFDRFEEPQEYTLRFSLD